MPPSRTLRRPLAPPAQRFRRVTVQTDGWIRVHWPKKGGLFTRNPEHRFSPPDGPYDVLYLARHGRTAALEVFGDRLYQKTQIDIASAEWSAREISTLAVDPLPVADLFSPAGLEVAQTDVSALTHVDLAVPQAWARAVMTHPDGFHGLLYPSRFTRQKCLALFATPSHPAPIELGPPGAFADSSAAAHLLRTFTINLT